MYLARTMTQSRRHLMRVMDPRISCILRGIGYKSDQWYLRAMLQTETSVHVVVGAQSLLCLSSLVSDPRRLPRDVEDVVCHGSRVRCRRDRAAQFDGTFLIRLPNMLPRSPFQLIIFIH